MHKKCPLGNQLDDKEGGRYLPIWMKPILELRTLKRFRRYAESVMEAVHNDLWTKIYIYG